MFNFSLKVTLLTLAFLLWGKPGNFQLRALSIYRKGAGPDEEKFKKVKAVAASPLFMERSSVFLDTYRLILAFTRPYEVLQRISLRLALWKVLSYI